MSRSFASRSTGRHTGSGRNAPRRARPRRQFAPSFEALEERWLPSSTGFLQGIVFADANGNGQFDLGETRLAGATITATPVGGGAAVSTVSGADGSYLIPGLAPGQYQLTESIAPAGYQLSAAQALSSVYPATVNNTTNTVTVTVLDSANLWADFLGYGNPPNDSTSVYGVTVTYTAFSSNPQTGGAGQFAMATSVGPPSTSPPPAPTFFSYCVDLTANEDINNPYPVLPDPGSSIANWGRIAYLYNHFNTDLAHPLDTTSAVALQVTIWELEYGNNFQFLSAANINGGDETAAVQSQINAYLSQPWQNEDALLLASNGPSLGGDAEQGVIASGSFNFGNVPGATTPGITTNTGGTVVLGSGAKLTDSATLSGLSGSSPGGTVTFNLYAPSDITYSSPVDTETVDLSKVAVVNGDVTVSTPNGYVPLVTGNYEWVATYSGDASNNTISSGNGNEPETVAPAPSITTNTGGTVVLGSGHKLTDSATLSGGLTPTGSITFNLYAPSDTTYSSPVDTETVKVTGDGTSSTPNGYTPLVTGTYEWVATYSGDSNNQSVSSGQGNEPETVAPAPSITTNTGGTVVLGSGHKLTDSATLSGGLTPTGSITFNLYAPSDTTYSSPVDTETVKVTGDGTYSTPNGYTPLVTGNYEWVATYSGDSNNQSVNSGQGNEPETVIPGTPDILVTKTADQASVSAGQTIGFTVTVTNPGTADATGVQLNDPLPVDSSSGGIFWKIDTSTGDPGFFQITPSSGTPGTPQVLSFNPSSITLAAGQTLTVHITSPTNAADAGVPGSAPSNSFDPTGTAAAGVVTLGTAANYAVLGLENTKINNSLVTVYGNEGVSQGGSLTNMAPSVITGNVYEYKTGQYSGPGKLYGSVITSSSLLTQNDTDALAASAAAKALPATQTFGSISTATTITGNGGLNVIDINGNISLGGSNSLILKGSASDVFIVNITGTLSINGSSQLGLAGGVTPNHVLWNFTGSGTIQAQVGNVWYGTILAPKYSYSLDGAFYGELIAGGSSISLLSGVKVFAGSKVTNTATVTASNVIFDPDDTASATVAIGAGSTPQLATGSTSRAGLGFTELLGSTADLRGTIGVAVDLPPGPQTQAEQAAIASTLATLNAEVGQLGLHLVQVFGTAADTALVQIQLASATDIGGADQGVLAAFSPGGQITLIDGWNWYFGANPAGIAGDQYDFQTVLTHELGHVLGLGENSDPSSAMSLYLSPGQVRRDLSATDLSAIEQVVPGLQPALVPSVAGAVPGVAAEGAVSSLAAGVLPAADQPSFAGLTPTAGDSGSPVTHGPDAIPLAADSSALGRLLEGFTAGAPTAAAGAAATPVVGVRAEPSGGITARELPAEGFAAAQSEGSARGDLGTGLAGAPTARQAALLAVLDELAAGPNLVGPAGTRPRGNGNAVPLEGAPTVAPPPAPAAAGGADAGWALFQARAEEGLRAEALADGPVVSLAGAAFLAGSTLPTALAFESKRRGRSRTAPGLTR